jgi:hypothetical protein
VPQYREAPILPFFQLLCALPVQSKKPSNYYVGDSEEKKKERKKEKKSVLRQGAVLPWERYMKLKVQCSQYGKN